MESIYDVVTHLQDINADEIGYDTRTANVYFRSMNEMFFDLKQLAQKTDECLHQTDDLEEIIRFIKRFELESSDICSDALRRVCSINSNSRLKSNAIEFVQFCNDTLETLVEELTSHYKSRAEV